MSESTKPPPTIAVDFDGCIAGGPSSEAVIELLRRLEAEGWHIIIHSCRTGAAEKDEHRDRVSSEMLAWLRWRSVPFHAIWGMQFATDWISDPGAVGKPAADVYLDDRAVSPYFLPAPMRLGGTATDAMRDVCCALARASGKDPGDDATTPSS